MSDQRISADVPLSAQAKLLSRYFREKGIADLTHCQALEALAHAQNLKSYNVLCTQQSKAPVQPQALLEQAIAAGLTSGEALNVFTKSRSEEDAAYLQAARDLYASEGELEFDDNAVVSVSEDGGAYVMGWRWVEDSDREPPKDVAHAFRRRFDHASVMLEDQDVDDDFRPSGLSFNEDMLCRYAAGESLPDATWLVRGCNAEEGQRFELTVRHFKALSWVAGSNAYEGVLGADSLSITFYFD